MDYTYWAFFAVLQSILQMGGSSHAKHCLALVGAIRLKTFQPMDNLLYLLHLAGMITPLKIIFLHQTYLWLLMYFNKTTEEPGSSSFCKGLTVVFHPLSLTHHHFRGQNNKPEHKRCVRLYWFD